jgi:hypothetical protein
MINKINKLMALALNNPSEEEARSAALKAVRLIAEHKAVVSLPAPKQPLSAWWSQPPPNNTIDYAAVQDAMRRAYAAACKQEDAWAATQTTQADHNGNPWK